MKKSEWQRRAQRATNLSERLAYAQQILRFYAEVLNVQGAVYDDVSSRPNHAPEGSGFRDSIRLADALPHLPALLTLVEQQGTETLAGEAKAIRSLSGPEQTAMLATALASEAAASFFARALLQPIAEFHASLQSPASGTPSACPICQSRPQASVLRPEGEGGKRFLLCSLCMKEWEFRRILCPVCGEQDYKKLPRYSAEEHPAVHVEACDTCHFYLKAIDLTVDGLAVPVVDEIAAVPLDLWAAEHGYKKPISNLMGF